MDEDLVLVGTPFLNKFTTVFDWETQKMGFYGEDVLLDEPVKMAEITAFEVFMILGVSLLLLVFTLFGLVMSRKQMLLEDVNREAMMEPLNADFGVFNLNPPNDSFSEERKSSLENFSQ